MNRACWNLKLVLKKRDAFFQDSRNVYGSWNFLDLWHLNELKDSIFSLEYIDMENKCNAVLRGMFINLKQAFVMCGGDSYCWRISRCAIVWRKSCIMQKEIQTKSVPNNIGACSIAMNTRAINSLLIEIQENYLVLCENNSFRKVVLYGRNQRFKIGMILSCPLKRAKVHYIGLLA